MGRIWECLKVGDAAAADDQKVLIGLSDVVGIDFWERRSGDLQRESIIQHLTQDGVED